MSRCFPYPPPGYTLSRHGEAALIDSIKLNKKREKDQKEKDKRREKREKRMEKKDRTLRSQNNEGQINGKIWPDTKGKLLDDEIKTETEYLERSNLTEEHGVPVRVLPPSSSLDSTENSSNNRKRPSSPIACPPRGKIIRIRLSKKQSGPDSVSNETQPCSTSVAVASEQCPVQSKLDHDFRSLYEGAAALANSHLEPQVEQRFPTADAAETGADPPLLDAAGSKKHRAYLRFKNLMEACVPPPLQDTPAPCDDDDMDWLFKSRSEECSRPQKRFEPISDALPCSASNSSVSWPRAHYLPEIGVYALPYTVPF